MGTRNPVVLVLVLETKRTNRGRGRERRGGRRGSSWEAPFRFSACIGTMNQIGTPLPALSPQGGERVAEGRERGGSWEAFASGWSRGFGLQPPLQDVAVWFNAFRLRHIFGEDLPSGAQLPEFAKVTRFVSHVQARGIDGPSAIKA